MTEISVITPLSVILRIPGKSRHGEISRPQNRQVAWAVFKAWERQDPKWRKRVVSITFVTLFGQRMTMSARAAIAYEKKLRQLVLRLLKLREQQAKVWQRCAGLYAQRDALEEKAMQKGIQSARTNLERAIAELEDEKRTLEANGKRIEKAARQDGVSLSGATVSSPPTTGGGGAAATAWAFEGK